MTPLAYLRLGIACLAAAVMFALGWKMGSAHASAQLQRAQAASEAKYLSAVERAREAERASYAKSQEVSRALQSDLAAIRGERDRLRAQPARGVRLCPDADPAGSGVSAAGAAPGRRDAAAAGATKAPGPAGRDIGRPLYELVDDGDEREAELARRLSACQAWAATR